MVTATAFSIAQKFIGLKELPGDKHEPFVLGMLRLDAKWVTADEVAWCSAYVNFIAWLLGLPRSRSLAARSWLQVGQEIHVTEAKPGSDVVILKRGSGPQPGADVIKAPGHVGFFAGLSADGAHVHVLGGNQGNAVSVARFPVTQLLGVRRLEINP